MNQQAGRERQDKTQAQNMRETEQNMRRTGLYIKQEVKFTEEEKDKGKKTAQDSRTSTLNKTQTPTKQETESRPLQTPN